VAKPNFRGSTGYGRDFVEAGYKQWGGVMQDDLQDAANYLIKKGFADPQKVCLVGGSYGGYAALMGMVKHSDFYHCAVSLNGVTDLIAQVKYNEERFKDYKSVIAKLHQALGHPSEDRVNLKANSPSSNADKITKPVLIIAGTSDWVVRYYQSKSLAKKLKSLDRPVEYMEVKDAYHNIFAFNEDKKNIYLKVAQFLEKNLKESKGQESKNQTP
jgi:dipeptidyl aminopeptidase/acylaminoacyl peptidase